MSLLLTCRITIGAYQFTRTSGVEIQSSWKTIGDTATLKMYGYANLENADGSITRHAALEKVFKVGDQVTIELGYDGVLRTEFTGYIAEISAKIPIELRCEDEFFHLKRQKVNRTWQNTTLADILKDLLPTASLSQNIPKLSISCFRADRTTAYGVLKELKDSYLLAAYFRQNKLFVGLPYTEFTSADTSIKGGLAKYAFQQNIINDELRYSAKEDVRMKVKVVALHQNGKKTTVPDVGDPDGVERTVVLHTETTDVAELKRVGLQKLADMKYDGYRGTFTTFGEPYLIHSGTAELTDPLRPERTGRYLVDSVNTSFGPQGFRREVEPSKRVSIA